MSKKPAHVSDEDYKIFLRVLFSSRNQNQKQLLVNPGAYRKTLWELNYFGSDLNKFVANKCRKDLTVNNIDLIMYDRNKQRIRFIEYKGTFEAESETQNKLLVELASIFEQSNGMFIGNDVEVYVVRANAPEFTENVLTDLQTGEKFLVGTEKLRTWLQFNYELTEEDIADKQTNLLI